MNAKCLHMHEFLRIRWYLGSGTCRAVPRRRCATALHPDAGTLLPCTDGPHDEGENEPKVGASCSTVTPGENEACCISKVQQGEEDEWCRSEYSYVSRRPHLLQRIFALPSLCAAMKLRRL
jgi:hypothetical protein